MSQEAIAKDGYIIAFQGKWGAGKTSTVELIIRYLRHLEMQRASSIAFATDRGLEELETMALTFERIEGQVISIYDQNKNIEYWEKSIRHNTFSQWIGSESDATMAENYLDLLTYVNTRPRTIVLRFSPWIFAGRVELAAALLSELARTLGRRLGTDVRAAFGRVLARLSELAPLGAAGVDLMTGSGIGRLVSSSSSLLKNAADQMTAGPSLEEMREQLKRSLRKLTNQQVVVVVDDVDRLTPGEALELITIVKGLGDLPNIVYILLYDEERLIKLLDKAILSAGARDYLDKIVQYSVQLPIIKVEDIGTFLEKDLRWFMDSLSDEETARFRFAWIYFMRYYLQTPRDVKRLVNNYSFASIALKEYTDPIDLLILEVIRIYEPSIYSWLKINIAEVVD
jgi:predicted KAP-like P-loop ATPase